MSMRLLPVLAGCYSATHSVGTLNGQNAFVSIGSVLKVKFGNDPIRLTNTAHPCKRVKLMMEFMETVILGTIVELFMVRSLLRGVGMA